MENQATFAWIHLNNYSAWIQNVGFHTWIQIYLEAGKAWVDLFFTNIEWAWACSAYNWEIVQDAFQF